MKIISYNVNGIRAAAKKGLLDWLQEEDFDLICLQETKAQNHQIPEEAFRNMGYNVYHHQAEKKGYSGVAVLSKIEPKKVKIGMDVETYDREGRVLQLDFPECTLINTYFPSGSSSEERHDFKMEFRDRHRDYILNLRKSTAPMIVAGDYNIVHTELDIHNPERKDNPSGYRPGERQWLTDWYNEGFVDSFRDLHPKERSYSWWSYRARSRERDKGWRIDYISTDERLQPFIREARQIKEAVHSDHCPVLLEIDWSKK
jgi:exodeoxyribonuclease-3